MPGIDGGSNVTTTPGSMSSCRAATTSPTVSPGPLFPWLQDRKSGGTFEPVEPVRKFKPTSEMMLLIAGCLHDEARTLAVIASVRCSDAPSGNWMMT